MIERVLETANALDPSTITLIVGHKAEAVRHRLGKTQNLWFALQEPQL